MFATIDKKTSLVTELNATRSDPDPELFIEIETAHVFDDIRTFRYTYNTGDKKFYFGGPRLVKKEDIVVLQKARPDSSDIFFIGGGFSQEVTDISELPVWEKELGLRVHVYDHITDLTVLTNGGQFFAEAEKGDWLNVAFGSGVGDTFELDRYYLPYWKMDHKNFAQEPLILPYYDDIPRGSTIRFRYFTKRTSGSMSYGANLLIHGDEKTKAEMQAAAA